jgi:hypothetical protein
MGQVAEPEPPASRIKRPSLGRARQPADIRRNSDRRTVPVRSTKGGGGGPARALPGLRCGGLHLWSNADHRWSLDGVRRVVVHHGVERELSTAQLLTAADLLDDTSVAYPGWSRNTTYKSARRVPLHEDQAVGQGHTTPISAAHGRGRFHLLLRAAEGDQTKSGVRRNGVVPTPLAVLVPSIPFAGCGSVHPRHEHTSLAKTYGSTRLAHGKINLCRTYTFVVGRQGVALAPDQAFPP